MKETNSSDDYDIDINACSTMDCTGLIPSLPQSEAELESYSDLNHYLPPVIEVKNSRSDSSKSKG